MTAQLLTKCTMPRDRYCASNIGTFACRVSSPEVRPGRRTRKKVKNTMNVLFVCSRNNWRSRTAETIFRDHQNHNVRSAGTENEARVKVSERLITWSELIFVMEKRHKQRLQDRFGDLLNDKKIVILDIEDNYRYMDEELIETLKTSVTPFLKSSEK